MTLYLPKAAELETEDLIGLLIAKNDDLFRNKVKGKGELLTLKRKKLPDRAGQNREADLLSSEEEKLDDLELDLLAACRGRRMSLRQWRRCYHFCSAAMPTTVTKCRDAATLIEEVSTFLSNKLYKRY